MSRFFDRIARQAAGPSKIRLRSSLQLPFASVPAEIPTTLHADAMPTASAPQEERVALLDPDPGGQENVQAAQASRPTDLVTPLQDPVDPAEVASAVPSGSATRKSAHLQDPETGASPRSGAVDRPAPVAAGKGPATGQRERSVTAPPEPASAQGTFSTELSKPPDGPRTGDLPTPLVPDGANAAVSPLGVQSDTPAMLTAAHPLQPGQSRRPAQEPEVHVHIGRVEVTSVAEPAPVQQPRPARRAPRLSLEAHLAKRGGGSS